MQRLAFVPPVFRFIGSATGASKDETGPLKVCIAGEIKHLRKTVQPKNYQTGLVPVYLRITVNGKRRLNGTKKETKSFNAYLDTLQNQFYDAHSQLTESKSEITAETLKNKFLGKGEKVRMLMDIFREHNKKIKTLVGKEYAAAYADVNKLKRNEIVKGLDGEMWIFTKRKKTDTPSRIPLLPSALTLLDKYADHPVCSNLGKALPEIADICGIDKPLTFHIARHTFATTVTLSNGVPIESAKPSITALNPITVLALQISQSTNAITQNQIVKITKNHRQAIQLLADTYKLLNKDAPPTFYKNLHCSACQFKNEHYHDYTTFLSVQTEAKTSAKPTQ
eukprot:gene7469-7533_t